MSMMKWSPFEEVEQLRKQIDNIFTPLSALGNETGHAYGNNAYGMNPPVDVVEAENAYKVRFLLPGLPTENLSEHVNIEATAKTLTVSGELRPAQLSQGEKLLVTQLRYGKFFKQLGFPDGIDDERIEASYGNGILEVVLPKAQTARKKNVQIQVK